MPEKFTAVRPEAEEAIYPEQPTNDTYLEVSVLDKISAYIDLEDVDSTKWSYLTYNPRTPVADVFALTSSEMLTWCDRHLVRWADDTGTHRASPTVEIQIPLSYGVLLMTPDSEEYSWDIHVIFFDKVARRARVFNNGDLSPRGKALLRTKQPKH